VTIFRSRKRRRNGARGVGMRNGSIDSWSQLNLGF
jgi:hypothetical protein